MGIELKPLNKDLKIEYHNNNEKLLRTKYPSCDAL